MPLPLSQIFVPRLHFEFTVPWWEVRPMGIFSDLYSRRSTKLVRKGLASFVASAARIGKCAVEAGDGPRCRGTKVQQLKPDVVIL